jgi:hypothetical protein
MISNYIMKIKTLIKTACLAAIMLITACGKDQDTASGTASLTQYYIAGQYNYNLSPSVTNVPIPYAIILNTNSACTFVDAIFGVVKGSYTYANGHLITSFGQTMQLVATFDFTIANNTISGASTDGLGLITYKLEKTPASNSFSNNEYTGAVTFTGGQHSFAYLSFSGSQYNIDQTGYNTPDQAYTLQNNAVATTTLNGVNSVFVFDNGAIMMMSYEPPAVVNGGSDYEYGTFTK